MKKYFNKVLPTLLVAALMLGTFQLVRSATPAEADVGGAGIAIGQFASFGDNHGANNIINASDAALDMTNNTSWTAANAGIEWNSDHAVSYTHLRAHET